MWSLNHVLHPESLNRELFPQGSNIKRVQEMEGIIRVDVRNDGVQSSVTIVATDKEKVNKGLGF